MRFITNVRCVMNGSASAATEAVAEAGMMSAKRLSREKSSTIAPVVIKRHSRHSISATHNNHDGFRNFAPGCLSALRSSLHTCGPFLSLGSVAKTWTALHHTT